MVSVAKEPHRRMLVRLRMAMRFIVQAHCQLNQGLWKHWLLDRESTLLIWTGRISLQAHNLTCVVLTIARLVGKMISDMHI